MLMLEFDLAGAEWVIVAYLTQDENMLKVVHGDRSPHVVTGHLISKVPEDVIEAEDKLMGHETNPDEIARLRQKVEGMPGLNDKGVFLPRSMTIRQMGKKSNHGLNYGMAYRRFALENEISETEAKGIVELYRNEAYPGLLKWYEDTKANLRKNDRTLENCFGRRVRLLGEWGPELFNKAFSFVPQSTVGDSINQAIRKSYESCRPEFAKMELCSQTHDSVMIQHPTDDMPRLLACIKAMNELIRPPLTYSGQTFRLNSDLKVGRKWGSLRELPMDDLMEERLTALSNTL